MKGLKYLVLGSLCAGAVWIASAAPAASTKKSDPKSVLYVCDCGAACKCDAVSVKAGKCKCGHDLKAAHALKVDGDQALLCGCGADCTCTIDPKDATKCGCGKDVRKMSLKGSGIYFCNCGSSCACNTFSDKAGKCKCGMALKKAS